MYVCVCHSDVEGPRQAIPIYIYTVLLSYLLYLDELPGIIGVAIGAKVSGVTLHPVVVVVVVVAVVVVVVVLDYSIGKHAKKSLWPCPQTKHTHIRVVVVVVAMPAD